jgi:glycosyltransferase involved in cell wall biosynthesis
MFSAVILTLNEEQALPACLLSLRGCDDIVVLDSGSTDQTVALSRAAGARVFVRRFDSFAGQRNFAQREIGFRHPWVLHLDADERLTPELAAEVTAALERSEIDGYRIAPKMIFQGRWIRHCTDYPAYQARLVRAPQFHFIQVGHGQREDRSMRMANLGQSYLHDLSIYGEASWLAKHRRYARAEALALLGASPDASPGRLFSADPLVRRRALKRLSFRLPLRPALRFGYQYLLRGGFLDGGPGWRYCRLLARYEGFIAEEIAQLKTSRAAGIT